ncbi:hypothetical protein AB0O91_15920 [Kitasatospora sp. NPDC089797]|uniref:hypothetical protein n=1 Tax=Kitasatospora sp. NPDC089797 TaxID=3155298 RepID=UPI003441D842
MATVGEHAAAPPYTERALIQGTAWVLVVLALALDMGGQSWRALAIAAGVVLLASTGLAVRLESVNLVVFLKRTAIWVVLILVVLLVELGAEADWAIGSVTGKEVTTATILVLIGDLVAEVRDHLSDLVGHGRHRDRIRDSVNTVELSLARLRRWTRQRGGRTD